MIRMKYKGEIWIALSFFASIPCFSQKKPYVTFGGYVKDLQTFSFIDNGDSVYLTNLIHNRINFSWKSGDHFAFNVGMRNLLYIGDQVKLVPDFSKTLDKGNGYLDLSYVWIDQKSLVLATKFDRANVEYNFKKGFIRAGRQRINWGMNLVWNPNDIFNSYNFLNFDYEERPGNDAVRFSYNLKEQSNIEVAVAPADNNSSWIGSLKYSFNKRGYDFQFIGGNYKTDVVGGIGFAGNIKQAGWKTEATYFQSNETPFKNSGYVSVSTGLDYGFKNGWYVNGSFLYCSAALDKIYSVEQLITVQLSPKTPMPDKVNLLLQTRKSFNAIFTGTFSVIYSPTKNLLIILPYLTYSIATNWDLDLFIQSFFAEELLNKYKTFGNSINVRLKWNY